MVAHVDRLRETSADSLYGQLTFDYTGPSNNGNGPSNILGRVKHDFTDPRKREALVKQLTQRFPPWDLNWPGIVESLCVRTVDIWREGYPAIRVGDIPATERLRWRLFPLLAEREINYLYGDGGSSKTLLAIYVASLISLPWSDGRWEPEPGNVLYLDWETHQAAFRERVCAIHAGLGIDADSEILYKRMVSPLAHDAEEIQRLVLAHSIDLVVVDSVGMAAGGPFKDDEFANNLARALRSLNVTALCVDHVSKEGNFSGKKDARNVTQIGTIAKRNMSRNQWYLRADDDSLPETLDVGLWHGKGNDTGYMRPLGIQWRFLGSPETGTTGIFLKHTQIKDVPEFEKTMSHAERIQNLLLDKGKMSPTAICTQLGIDIATVRSRLNGRKDLFVKDGAEWGVLWRE